jgi:hypothetical protein
MAAAGLGPSFAHRALGLLAQFKRWTVQPSSMLDANFRPLPRGKYCAKGMLD